MNAKEIEDIFNDKISKLNTDTINEIMPNLIVLYSLNEFIDFIVIQNDKYYPNKNNNNIDIIKSDINWIGTNETEFIQLIYALHEGKYIEGKGITKMVEEFSKLLNYPLNKNWQSNHSKSIHESNSDYAPKIFNKLGESYKQYQKKQIEKRK